MNIARIPGVVPRIFKSLTWRFEEVSDTVYLTFDDGPTPEITPQVLDLLEQHNAKASFFCLGKNVKQNPELYQRIIDSGHLTANHTYSHLKGFRRSVKSYVRDVEKAGTYIDSPLFRPPYGRIRPSQLKYLKKKYQIIMWTVLSVDYDSRLPGDRIVKNVIDNVYPGSIIVFHDSIKAGRNLLYALPVVLEHLTSKNLKMEVLPIKSS